MSSLCFHFPPFLSMCLLSQMVVIDASNRDRLTQACTAMKVQLEDPKIAPLPCLILLNKKNKKLTDAEVS